jgi:hypothetical protein
LHLPLAHRIKHKATSPDLQEFLDQLEKVSQGLQFISYCFLHQKNDWQKIREKSGFVVSKLVVGSSE